MDIGEEQQLCCRAVHLLLFQKSLCRELLAEAGIHRPGRCCPCGLGGFLLPHPTVLSDPQRDNAGFEPWARPLCVQFPGHWRNSDQHTMTPRKNVQQCGTSCHCTPAEDSHTVLQSSQLLCLPHPACGFTTNAGWVPVGFFNWGMATEKDPTGFEMRAKNSSWILRFGWMTSGISVFKSGSSCWWHSQP